MSSARIGLALRKGFLGTASGLVGAALITFSARHISALSPVDISQTAVILSLGNLIYGLSVSDANGNDRVQEFLGVDSYASRVQEAYENGIRTMIFHASAGNTKKACEAFMGNEAREKLFVEDFLYSLFEQVTAGTIGFGMLMLFNPSSISLTYRQLIESIAIGSFASSSFKSLSY